MRTCGHHSLAATNRERSTAAAEYRRPASISVAPDIRRQAVSLFLTPPFHTNPESQSVSMYTGLLLVAVTGTLLVVKKALNVQHAIRGIQSVDV